MTRRALPALLAATLAAPPLLASNTNHYYVGPDNSLFSSPANWSLSPNGPGGSPPSPSGGDNAIVSPTTSPLSLTLDASPANAPLATLSLSGSPSSPLSLTHTGSLTATTALIGPYTSYAATGSASAYFYPIIDGANASLSLNAPSGNFQFHQGVSVGPSAGGSFSISNGYVFLEHPATFGGSAGTASGLIAGGTLSGAIRLDSAALATVSQTAGQVSAVYPARNASYSLSGGTVGSVAFAVKDTFYPPIPVPTDHGATFTQTGGTVTGNVTVNPYSPSTPALYSLAATGVISSPSSNPTLTVASAYAATFLQSGGTVGGGPNSSLSPSGPDAGDPSAIYLGRTATPGTPSTGTYSLSGPSAQLFTNKLFVGHGDHGTFSQSAGSVSLRGTSPTFSVGTAAAATGSYALSGGSLSFTPSPGGSPLFAVGDAGAGSFSHTGGSVSLAPTYPLFLGNNPNSTGSYSLSGPSSTLTAYYQYVGYSGTGSFSQSDGYNGANTLDIASQPGSSGSYSLSGGSLAATLALVGNYGSGTLALSGGTATLPSLHLAQSSGSSASLSLTGGTLVTTNPLLGVSGRASVTHSAGTLSASSSVVELGYSPSATTSYSLSGSASLVAGSLDVGKDPSAPASFSQSGGSVSLSSLRLPAAFPGVPHAYSLAAGSLSVSSTTSNNASFSQSGGTASLSSVTGTGSLTLTGLATLTARSIRQSSLSLADGAFAVLLPSTTPSSLSSLTLAGAAALDLSTDTLLLNHPSGASPADTIRSNLLLGRLRSSATDPTHRLAYSDTSSTLTLHLALSGDTNLDGEVDGDDYALLDKNFAAHTPNAYWWNGDFNYDGVVDQNDYLLIDTTLGQAQGFSPGFLSMRGSQFGAQYVHQLVASVPEPLPLSSLLYPLFSLLLTRRRNN